MRIIRLLTIIVILSVSPILLQGEDDSDLFTFVRLKYGGELTRRSSWQVDWPASDRNFIWQLRKQTNIAVAPYEKIIEVGAAELFEYPFAYMLEVGSPQAQQARGRKSARVSLTRRVYLHRRFSRRTGMAMVLHRIQEDFSRPRTRGYPDFTPDFPLFL